MPLDVHSERYQSKALLSRGSCQFRNLSAVQKQLPWTSRLVVVYVSLGVRRYVAVEQPHIAALEPGEGVLNVHVRRPDRLDLRTRENQASLHRLQNIVVVIRSAVHRDDLEVAIGSGTLCFRNGPAIPSGLLA